MANKIANEAAALRIANLETFETYTGSFWSRRYEMLDGTITYSVYSYSTLMLELKIVNGTVYMITNNIAKYSRTTSRHQFYIKLALNNMSIDSSLPSAWINKLYN